MVLHSSELMPRDPSNADDVDRIEQLYRDLHAMFALVEKAFVGMTLSEYRMAWMAERVEATPPGSLATRSLHWPLTQGELD